MMESLKKLFKNKFGQDLHIDESIAENYHVSRPLNTSDILSIYSIRYKVYQDQNKKNDREYELLIESLKAFKEPQVLLHRVRVGNSYIICFTDASVSELIGILKTDIES